MPEYLEYPRIEYSPRATGVRCDDVLIHVPLADGREISVPLGWFPRLMAASPEQRENWEMIGPGEGICWPDLDEDISVESLMRMR